MSKLTTREQYLAALRAALRGPLVLHENLGTGGGCTADVVYNVETKAEMIVTDGDYSIPFRGGEFGMPGVCFAYDDPNGGSEDLAFASIEPENVTAEVVAYVVSRWVAGSPVWTNDADLARVAKASR